MGMKGLEENCEDEGKVGGSRMGRVDKSKEGEAGATVQVHKEVDNAMAINM